MNMQMSKTGLALIRSFERLMLKGYIDATGTPTIGYGHTENPIAPIFYRGGKSTQSIIVGEEITEEEADSLLVYDVGNVEKQLNKILSKISLSQYEYDAICSLVFNIGIGAFQKSSILTKLKQGDKIGAANIILLYNKSKGQVLNGLTRRRKAEKALFEGDVEICAEYAHVCELPGYNKDINKISITEDITARIPDGTIGTPALLSTTIWSQIGNIVTGCIVPLGGFLTGMDWKTILAIGTIGAVAFSLYTIKERLRHAKEFGV